MGSRHVCLVKAGLRGLVIDVEDIVEMIASDSDASASVGSRCLLVARDVS